MHSYFFVTVVSNLVHFAPEHCPICTYFAHEEVCVLSSFRCIPNQHETIAGVQYRVDLNGGVVR